MDQHPCPGQLLHQRADAAGVVQVHMGGNHPVDLIPAQPQRIQGSQQAGHGQAGAGVDEGRVAVIDDQVGRIEMGPLEQVSIW
jgi:hypothetical protein